MPVTDPGLGLGGMAPARLAVERQPGTGLAFATGEDIGAVGDIRERAVLLRKPHDERALIRAMEAAWLP